MNRSKALATNVNKMNVNNEDKFKATKLWNEIVYCFYMGIPVDKHRRNMRLYYDCFVACEAVSWLHEYLKNHPNFCQQQISRFQALNLLRKFTQSEIIEKVNGKSENYEFQDNKDLYKFTKKAHENLPFLLELSKVELLKEHNDKENQHNNNTNVESSKNIQDVNGNRNNEDTKMTSINSVEKVNLWKQVFFKHLKSLFPKVDILINIEEVNSILLMHNFTRISKNGVVQLTDKSEDLPHWVMSAMKCLANWPNASGTGSCLPKYPGFEADVFNVIREYFVNMGIPLIPYELYNLFIAIYDDEMNRCNLKNKTLLKQDDKVNNISPSTTLQRDEISSLINNGLRTSTPVYVCNGNIQDNELPPNYVYETIFVGDSPVTKVVSINELEHLFVSNPRILNSNPSLLTNARQRSENMLKSKSGTIEEQISRIEKSRSFNAVTTLPRRNKNKFSKNFGTLTSPNNSNSFPDKDSNRFCYKNLGFVMQSPNETGEYMMDKSVSFSSSFCHSSSSHSDVEDSLDKNAEHANSQNNFNHFNLVSDPTFKTIQLALFLLPPANRRQLHLLLRLLSKIINNKEMHLFTDEKFNLKSYLFETFTRSILCATKESEYDEIKSQKIVCLLLDNCTELFKVPEYIIDEVKNSCDQMGQIQKQEDSSIGKQFFCKQITTEEFELQRDVLSQHALADLLRSIIRNENINEKEKLKLIKQFKVHHPDIYDWYFKSENPFKIEPKQRANTFCQGSNLLRRILSVRF